MKTEAEIRERIAEEQRIVDREKEYGEVGSETWCDAMTVINILRWVLGR